MSDDDDESAQLGQREADSLSGDYLSTEDLESAVLDSSEDQLDMRALLPITSSNSREDEDMDWETPKILSPDNSGAIPQISTQQIVLERDQVMAGEKASLPTSLEVMYPTSLMEDTDFTIEKVLGETTANILMEAEVAASKFANEFKELEATFDSDMDEPHSILTCRICQLFVRTVDRLLDQPDELRDDYLPLTEEEIANLKKAAAEIDDPVADHQVQACLDRINNLASKLRQRAYMKALSKLRLARRNTQESLCQLHQTMNLIGQVQHEEHPQSHQSYRKLSAITVEWTQRRPRPSLPPPFEELKEATSRDEGVGSPVAESTRLSAGSPVAESTQLSVGPPVAESTRVDDIGPPLAQSSGVEQTVEFSRADETEPPSLEISRAELTAGPEAIPEKALPPPAERSHADKTRTQPPPEISCTDDVSLPALEISRPEEDVKPATGVPEHIHRDTANITMEAKALEMSRSLAHNLRGTYENLLAHLKDLPEDLRQKLCQTCRDMAALGSDFDSAHRFGDLPHGLLNKSFEVMAEAQGSLDELMEYALQSPKALLWLKDHLSNLEEPEPEHVLREDVPLPAEVEEEGVSLPGKIEEDRDLIRLQAAYDPKGCEEDERPSEEEPRSRRQAIVHQRTSLRSNELMTLKVAKRRSLGRRRCRKASRADNRHGISWRCFKVTSRKLETRRKRAAARWRKSNWPRKKRWPRGTFWKSRKFRTPRVVRTKRPLPGRQRWFHLQVSGS
ncbi:hypothetical protein JRQ81_008880 [Phrynocephalus forsythii]|uniref:Uncharacterized protein n=1 Tax=Phrynocephalus forsythii TaxID=171643 RepID=A0A9Q0XE87_9SAUR|nr:hypothetical protein JRQ81_008880 [Phrynocephalus forsythii]